MAMSGITFKNNGGVFLKSGREQGSYVAGDKTLYALAGKTKLKQSKSLPTNKDSLEKVSVTDKSLVDEQDALRRYKGPLYLKNRLLNENRLPLAYLGNSNRKTSLQGVTKLTRLPMPWDIQSRIDHRHGPKRSIETLQVENVQLYQDYQELFRQNQMLREKLTDSKSDISESVKRVYFDRDVLRDAEHTYIGRIKQLQKENRELSNQLKSALTENESLKASPRGDNLATESPKVQKRCSELSQMNRDLQYKFDKLKRERDRIVEEQIQTNKQSKALKSKVSILERRVESLEKELEYMLTIEYR